MSNALVEQTLRNQIYIEQYKASEAARFENFLSRIDKDLRARLSGDELTDYSRARLERLLSAVDKSLEQEFGSYRASLIEELGEFGEYESQFEARSLESVINDPDFESVIPTAQQVRSAIFSNPLSVRGAQGGKLIEPFIEDWTKGERSLLTGLIRQGYFEGQTNAQIIRALRGTAAAKFKDGALATVNRHAEAITRTAIQHTAAHARRETWKTNTEVIKAVKWVSTLDSRTSVICRSLDGKEFAIGKGIMPPAHIACRSTTVAVLKDKYTFLSEGRTRASMDGTVDAKESYYSWLKKQPVEFQEDVIGVKRAKLLRDGGLSAKRFAELQISRKYKPLTLKEMQEKEPNAFIRAFGQGEQKTPQKRRESAVTKSAWHETEAGEWHKVGFDKSARKDIREIAIKNQDIEMLQERGGAFARMGKAINMPKSYSRDNADHVATWRHEFGHIVDRRYSKLNKQHENEANYSGYMSSQRRFLLARDEDRKELVNAAGRNGRLSKAKRDAWTNEKANAYKESMFLIKDDNKSEHDSILRKYAAERDLDYDRFKPLMQRLGFVDLDDTRDARRLMRIMDAIKFRDAEVFYVEVTDSRIVGYVERAKRKETRGALGGLSDAVSACTVNKVCSYNNSFPAHTNSYLKKRSVAAPTEMFANLTDAYGFDDPYWFDVFSRFVPKSAEVFRKMMKEIKAEL